MSEVPLQIFVGPWLGFHGIHVLLCKESSLLLQEGSSMLLESSQPVCSVNRVFGVRTGISFVQLGEVFCETGQLALDHTVRRGNPRYSSVVFLRDVIGFEAKSFIFKSVGDPIDS